MNLKVLILLFFMICCFSEAYNVLLFFPLGIRSLNILGAGFARHLLDAGHEVTFVTSFPVKNPHKNLRQIDVSNNAVLIDAAEILNITAIMSGASVMNDVQGLQEFGYHFAVTTFGYQNIQDLLNDQKTKFDVIVAELYETEIYAGLAALFECPLIWAYSMGAHWQTLRLIDEPTNPAYTTDYLSSNVPPLNFVQRFEELGAQIKWIILKRLITMPKEEAAYKSIFGRPFAERGRKLPHYSELIYNASMILANDHNSYGFIPKTPQNFKFVGGQHIQTPAKLLPEDLQSLMDNVKRGVIYFSMGSTWKSKDIPKKVTRDLLKMFGEFKQTVIWKYEEDLPNLPENVHILKWAPQQSILSHPNCLFFITHGGQLSSTEAIHFGVPIIGVPIYFDQFININKAVGHGYAIKVALTYDLAHNLKIAMETMLNNPTYRQRVKELSLIYHDRPVPPGKELVHWVEHVVRTRGAPHLRSPALMLPWYQKAYLDLVAAVATVLTLMTVALKKLFIKKSSKSQPKHKKN